MDFRVFIFCLYARSLIDRTHGDVSQCSWMEHTLDSLCVNEKFPNVIDALGLPMRPLRTVQRSVLMNFSSDPWAIAQSEYVK